MPAAGGGSELYSRKTGFIYIFNLIVGTGALALPAAFAKAGWLLGLGIILVLAFISFMTATFVIEAMSIANSVLLKTKRSKSRLDGSLIDDDDTEQSQRYLSSRVRDHERDPLIPPEFGDQNEDIRRQISTASTFEIVQRVEMGRMAAMFLPKSGLYLFYLCLCIYLYGDLAIYITAVATSLRDITCTYNANLSTSSIELELSDTDYGAPGSNDSSSNSSDILPDGPCWSETIQVTRYDAYRLYTIVFILVLGPFTFFNVQKTKYLQIFTTTMRWAAFFIMITLATIKLAKGDGLGHPPTADVLALPNFFGICVYSFMCHHSLPSLVSPIESKRGIFRLFFLDYTIITAFYLLLALTGIFAFDDIKALYTLNFEPEPGEHVAFLLVFIQYFLSLFPVFTLSTNFPIIAITLRNNLRTLFNLRDDEDEDDDYYIDDSETTTTEPIHGLNNPDSSSNTVNEFNATTSSGRDRRLRSSGSSWCLKLCTLIGFPLLAIAPPFTVALFVENVQLLVSVTGSYAGTGIQYIVPMALVYQGRNRLNPSTISMNPYSSPFRHSIWIWFVIVWSAICVIFVTVNYIMHPGVTAAGGPTASYSMVQIFNL